MLAFRRDDTLVHLAARVVLATVTKVPVPKVLGRCVLEVEFQVDRVLKGPGMSAAPGLLTIPVPYHVSPSGILPSFNFPHFSPGECYAIFLSRRGVPLEFVHLRGQAMAGITSIETVTEMRPMLPPARTLARDGAFGRVPASVACALHPASVLVRHEAHMVLEGCLDGINPREFADELGAAAAMWNDVANVVVFAGPHGRIPITVSRELPLHGAGLAVTDWQLDRTGTIVDARITVYTSNEAGPIPWSTEPRPGMFDLRSTVAHEIGHILGLRHSSTLGDLMEGSAARKGVRRVLTDGDRARLRGVYPFAQKLDADALAQAAKNLMRLSRELRRFEELRAGGNGAGATAGTRVIPPAPTSPTVAALANDSAQPVASATAYEVSSRPSSPPPRPTRSRRRSA